MALYTEVIASQSQSCWGRHWLQSYIKHTWEQSQPLDVQEHPFGGLGWTLNWNSSFPREACNFFQKNNQKETLMSHPFPSRPWSKVGWDILCWNKGHYFVFVDWCSDWIEFDQMKNQTAAGTIGLIQKEFAWWGISNEIVTDCGKTMTHYDPCSNRQIIFPFTSERFIGSELTFVSTQFILSLDQPRDRRLD